MIEYQTWRRRFIPPQPRSVHWSDELRSSPGATTYREALDALERKVKAGEDLTPHLSGLVHRPFDNVAAPALEHRTDRDALLADWGIHHHARADRIKVRTGVNDHLVYAVLAESSTAARLDENDRYQRMLDRVVPLAAQHRHEPIVILRDGDESLFECQRCSAIAYADATDDSFGGPLLEDDCPHDDPPAATALTFMHATGEAS